MMILIALAIHLLGHKIPVWITGLKLQDARESGGWRRIYFEMSGVLFDFLIAFLLLTIVGLSTKEKYLLNENVIYGLNFSQYAKTLGFKNGDKIVSVNDAEVVEFNDILPDMLYAFGDVRIGVKRDNYDTIIILTGKETFDLFKDGKPPFMPKLNADSTFNPRNDLVYSERPRSISKSLSFFPMTVRHLFQYFAPKHKLVGGFSVIQVTNLASFINLIGFNLIFLGFINLLPIPGLDLGNTIIAMIEMTRKKRFNQKRIKVIRYIFIGLISLMMLMIILYSKL